MPGASKTSILIRVQSAVVPLDFEGSPSLFKGSYQLTQAGFYQAVVSATQQSTGNLGTATVTFYVDTGTQ